MNRTTRIRQHSREARELADFLAPLPPEEQERAVAAMEIALGLRLDERAALTARVAELEASEARLIAEARAEVERLKALGEIIAADLERARVREQKDMAEWTAFRTEHEQLRSRLATVERALCDLLLSADCTWEEQRLGHGWAEACEAARAALSPTLCGARRKEP